MQQLPAGFAGRVVRWQRTHGRNTLPWQNTRDPYRVWLSEIMLQQTQVAAVLGYYDRFLTRFPDVRALAKATIDDVLALWSGLGYYSRARNLHRCAQEVMERFGGEFPRTAQQLASLPGIGASTAAAISSFCFGEPRHEERESEDDEDYARWNPHDQSGELLIFDRIESPRGRRFRVDRIPEIRR